MTPAKPPAQDPQTHFGTPDAYPVNPPPGLRAADYNWILQVIMELQSTTGQLKQAVTTLADNTKDHGKKLDSISHRMYAATAVLTVVGGILYFFLDRMWSQILLALTHLPALPK